MQRILAVFVILAGCGGGGSGDRPVDAGPIGPEPDATPGGFDKRDLLVAAADCVVGEYQSFRAAAVALESAAVAFAATPDEPNRAAVQAAWQAAMASWEIAELYQIGPAALSTEPGGQDLRDQIYSWPLTSACKIDEQLVSKAYEKDTFATTSLVSGRGLGALEYLVYYTGSDNACTGFSPINANGDSSPWKLLSAEELRLRRAAYALAVARALTAQADKLLAAWAGGGFRAALVGAGDGSSMFASTQAGLNAVSNAFFYLDKAVKDAKIAIPAGMSGCAEATCPNLVESRYARRSLAHLEANLVGFDRLFAGCSGTAAIGFDDWLVAADGPALAADMLAAIADTRAAIAALGSLEDVLASQPEKLRDLHASFKVITDLLKADLVTVLDLELPASVESDND